LRPVRPSRSDSAGKEGAPDSATNGAAPPAEAFAVTDEGGSPLVGSALDPTERPAPLHASRAALPPRLEERAGFLAVLRRRDFRYL
jgi:hypothetical protein